MQHEVSKRINQALDLIPSIPKDYGRTSAAAKLFGESHQSVRLWLGKDKNGKVGMPHMNKLAEVAKTLGVTIDWLLTGNGPMQPDTGIELFVNADILGKAIKLATEELTRFGYAKLSYNKQSQILAIIYETLKEGSDLDDSFVSYLKRHIRTIM